MWKEEGEEEREEEKEEEAQTRRFAAAIFASPFHQQPHFCAPVMAVPSRTTS